MSQLEALADHGGLEVTALCAPALAAALRPRRALRIVRLPTLAMPLRLVVEQLVVYRYARAADVVYMPSNFAAFMCPRPQIVTFQNAYHFGRAGREASRHLPRRVRAQVAVERRLASLSLRRANAVAAVSASLAAAIEADCPSTGKVKIVASAVSPLPSAPPARRGRPYVLAVSNDHVHKDWDGLAETFERHADLPQLVVVGAARTARRAERLRRTFSRTTWLGAVTDRQQLSSLYQGAACCVVHSHLESFSLAVLESLAAGCPVAATAIPAHVELSAGGGVALYPPDDPVRLVAAVHTALATPAAPQRHLRTWEDNAAQLAALLRGAAGR